MCSPASCYELLWRNGRTRERLRREFRNVHQYTIQGAHQTPRKEPTSTTKLRIDLVHLSSDPSTRAPSLPHLYAYAQPAFHTRFIRQTNSTPPPSVRTRNLRTQECSYHRGSLRSTSRISSLLTSMRACALGLGSKVGRSKSGSRARVLRVCFSIQTSKQRSDKIRDYVIPRQITTVISHKIVTGSDSRDKG
jgi:hypothetical protein